MAANKSQQQRRAEIARMRERQKAQERRQKLVRNLLTVGVIVALIAGATLLVVLGTHKKHSSTSAGGETTGATAAAVAVSGEPGVESYTGLSRNHVTTAITYRQTPPVGGDHDPVWLNCGVYTSPVPNQHAVHALEHGAVWITYQPSLPQAQVDALKADLKGKAYTVLSPYPNLPSAVVATAWGVQLKVDSASDPRIMTFLNKYVQGPQTPEPGAACTGGYGSPASTN